MATGLLLLGVGSATRLLGHLAGHDKTYEATIRLGQATVTDDREGEVVSTTSAAHLTDDDVRTALAAQTGPLLQVPSSVSAVKVAGRRSYDRVRAGEEVELAPRAVTVHRIDVHRIARPTPDLIDVDVTVVCTAGTYIRAIARDAGAALAVGGHLTALRRTRVGAFTLAQAVPLDELTERSEREGVSGKPLMSLADAARTQLPVHEVTAEDAARIGHGQRVVAGPGGHEAVAAIDPTGRLVAILDETRATARPRVVFPVT
jgi:tRNA pseudouridine55 synthase